MPPRTGKQAWQLAQPMAAISVFCGSVVFGSSARERHLGQRKCFSSSTFMSLLVAGLSLGREQRAIELQVLVRSAIDREGRCKCRCVRCSLHCSLFLIYGVFNGTRDVTLIDGIAEQRRARIEYLVMLRDIRDNQRAASGHGLQHGIGVALEVTDRDEERRPPQPGRKLTRISTQVNAMSARQTQNLILERPSQRPLAEKHGNAVRPALQNEV